MMSQSVATGRVAAVLALTALLGGCGATFDYQALRDRTVEGDGFTASLSREYREIALFEADGMHDWPDAARFGEKALAAADGGRPLPDSLVGRRLTKGHQATLTEARRRLDAVMDEGADRLQPATSARAQARYDCWIEQREENWQRDHIARCREEFYAALARLEAELVMPRAAAMPTGMVLATAGESAVIRHEPRAYTAFFPFDSAEMTLESRLLAERIVDSLPEDRPVAVVVSGHADRAGKGRHNEKLALRRAAAFRQALIDLGADPRRITATAHGERYPRILTPDGMAESRNRRVEITVAPTPAL